MPDTKGEKIVSGINADISSGLLDRFLKREEMLLGPHATPSSSSVRRRPDKSAASDFRTAFAIDADRILHSQSFTRYIDKTQVFSLLENDNITRRVIHIQLLSKIARTIGRVLRLNEDLIEAIALGHDIGQNDHRWDFDHDADFDFVVVFDTFLLQRIGGFI